jgi:aspartate ammonia-lyase
MGWSLFKSIQHLGNACGTLRRNCVDGIEANREFLARRVRESVTLVTALNPIIGYEKAALIAKTALATGGPIDVVAESLGILTREQMDALLVPEHLTQPVRLSTPVPAAAVPTGTEAANPLPSTR